MNNVKLTFLGTGSFFVNGDNYHTNILLEKNNKSFLIDCGSDIKRSLYTAKKDPGIDAVYISHLHGDHCGGFEWLAFYSYFASQKKPKLFACEFIANELWNMNKPSLLDLADLDANLNTYFNVREINYFENTFVWEDIEFDLIPVAHIPQKMASVGLSFEINGKTIWITTDSCEADIAIKEDWWNSPASHNPLAGIYYGSDIIFHDCEIIKCSMCHSHYSELKKFPSELKEKIWLVHYSDLYKLPDAKKDGFAGFVKCGQEFKF